jgi:hypothetical protein
LQFLLVALDCIADQVFLCDQVRFEIMILEELVHCYYKTTVKCVIEIVALIAGTCMYVSKLFVTEQTHDDGRDL